MVNKMDVSVVSRPSTDQFSNASTDDASRTSSGFQTFLMTGDAIIHTNYTPAKKSPTLSNQEPIGEEIEPKQILPVIKDESPRQKPKLAALNVERYDNAIDNHVEVSDAADCQDEVGTPAYTPTKLEGKEFIPGFIRVEDGSALAENGGSDHQTLDISNDTSASSNGLCTHTDESMGSIESIDDINLDMSGSASKCNITVDQPSAIRLAKRLHTLDGFKRSDVSRHLNKNKDADWLPYILDDECIGNGFSQRVAEEYLKYFDFTDLSLVEALRNFFGEFTLIGETQERERVLRHLTHRYMMSNPMLSSKYYQSEDDCHTLVCAIMLLNTDLHGQNISKKMTLNDFNENLHELNSGKDFPKDLLKSTYNAIKQEQLKWSEDDVDDVEETIPGGKSVAGSVPKDLCPDEHAVLNTQQSGNQYLSLPNLEPTEYKSGVLMRKHCKGPDGIDTAGGKRSWKKSFVVMRDMLLYLLKSEKSQLKDPSTKIVHIHHSLASVNRNYKKRKFTFTLITADWSEYLFSTHNAAELEDWVNTINLVTSTFSAQPLAAGVGSQKRFHRPLLPSSHTKHHMSDQCRLHKTRLEEVVKELNVHESTPPPKDAKKLSIQNYKDKLKYLQHERQRYMIYSTLLAQKLKEYPELEMNVANSSIGEVDEPQGTPRLNSSSIHSATSLELRSPANSLETTDENDATVDGMYINMESYVTKL